MKKHEITCDLCNITVAEKDDCFFSKFETKIPYITIPYNYIGADYCCATDYGFSCNAKSDFHICENCLCHIKEDLKRKRGNNE